MVYGETQRGEWIEFDPAISKIIPIVGREPSEFYNKKPIPAPRNDQVTLGQLQAWIDAFLRGAVEKSGPQPEETKSQSLYERIQKLRKK